MLERLTDTSNSKWLKLRGIKWTSIDLNFNCICWEQNTGAPSPVRHFSTDGLTPGYGTQASVVLPWSRHFINLWDGHIPRSVAKLGAVYRRMYMFCGDTSLSTVVGLLAHQLQGVSCPGPRNGCRETRCGWRACGPPTEGGHAAQLMKCESYSASQAYSSFNGSIFQTWCLWVLLWLAQLNSPAGLEV